MLTLAADHLPGLFKAADHAAHQGQRSAVRWRRTQLSLLLVAAVAGLWPDAGDYSPAAAVAGGAFAVVLVCELTRASTIPEKKWYEGRAGAESIKTLAWRYAVCGHPYESFVADADRDFRKAVRGVTDTLDDLDWAFGNGEDPALITPAMRELRAGSLQDRKAAYRAQRISDQRRWYSQRGAAARRNARRWSSLVTVATALGLVAAVVQTAGLLEVNALGFFSAAAAAAAAWTQFRQHEALASAYSVAARELVLVEDRLIDCDDDETWARLVDESESAISREHTMWAAKHDVRPLTGPRPTPARSSELHRSLE